MKDVIDVAAIEDNRMFVDGLRAWAETMPDIRLVAVTSTAEELLRAPSGQHYVVLLNPTLRPIPALLLLVLVIYLRPQGLLGRR